MNEIDIIIDAAKDALSRNKTEEALSILDEISIQGNSDAIFLKGEIYFKLQQWGASLNHFSMYLEAFPSDKKAESYCAMIQNILGFYNKDLYNP